MMSSDLTREDVLQLLSEVGAELQRNGRQATIYVVGGAAMALEYDTRRVTRDIDATVGSEPESFWPAVRLVGQAHHLPPNWLNTSAAGFLSNEEDTSAGEISFPGMQVGVASPEHLIAMKLRSMRTRDLDDLDFLFRHLGLTNPQQAADIHNRLFSDSDIGYYDPDEALYAAQRVFASADATGHPIDEQARAKAQDNGSSEGR